MPSCQFYAAKTDHRLILEFIFQSRECTIYEKDSDMGERIRIFNSINDIEKALKIKDWQSSLPRIPYLQLHVLGSGKPILHEIHINNAAENLLGTRYKTRGWGLIQLYLETTQNGQLRPSYTNHNTEKRAKAWAATHPELGPADDWDFEAITKFSGKLNRYIKKLSIEKAQFRPLLPGAASEIKAGAKLSLN